MICRLSKLFVSVLILPVGLCFCACNGCDGDNGDDTDASVADCTVEQIPLSIDQFCGLAKNDIYALGGNKGMMHYDGTGWSDIDIDVPTISPRAMWCFGGNDIFIAGHSADAQIESLIRHYDGQTWTDMEHPGPYEKIIAIWGASPNDVFAVADGSGGENAILHYDGQSWSVSTSDYGFIFDKLWGTSGTDVYAVGTESAIAFHYNGEVWSEITLPSSAEIELIRDVWGTGPNNLYFVGGTGGDEWGEESFPVIVHYDGSNWTPTVLDWWWDEQWDEPPNESFEAIWGYGDDSIYAVGTKSYYYDGTDWLEMKDIAVGNDVWGASAEETWVASGFMYKVSCQ